MKRKLSKEERQTLLETPELVMFEGWSGFQTHRFSLSLGKLLIAPVVAAVLAVIFYLLFRDFCEAHPVAVPAAGVGLLAAACILPPVVLVVLENMEREKAVRNHFRAQLAKMLPMDLVCEKVLIKSVVIEKAEGTWIREGKEEFFGYVRCVNSFPMVPNEELVIVSGKSKPFYAFIKRDPRTESLYTDEEKEEVISKN